MNLQLTEGWSHRLVGIVAGSQMFSCLHLKQGFHQLALNEQSTKLTSFLTPFRKKKYLILPMGTCDSLELFYHTMTDVFSDIPASKPIIISVNASFHSSDVVLLQEGVPIEYESKSVTNSQ